MGSRNPFGGKIGKDSRGVDTQSIRSEDYVSRPNGVREAKSYDESHDSDDYDNSYGDGYDDDYGDDDYDGNSPAIKGNEDDYMTEEEAIQLFLSGISDAGLISDNVTVDTSTEDTVIPYGKRNLEVRLFHIDVTGENGRKQRLVTFYDADNASFSNEKLYEVLSSPDLLISIYEALQRVLHGDETSYSSKQKATPSAISTKNGDAQNDNQDNLGAVAQTGNPERGNQYQSKLSLMAVLFAQLQREKGDVLSDSQAFQAIAKHIGYPTYFDLGVKPISGDDNALSDWWA